MLPFLDLLDITLPVFWPGGARKPLALMLVLWFFRGHRSRGGGARDGAGGEIINQTAANFRLRVRVSGPVMLIGHKIRGTQVILLQLLPALAQSSNSDRVGDTSRVFKLSKATLCSCSFQTISLVVSSSFQSNPRPNPVSMVKTHL